jgi:hypothetical protein
MPSNRVRIIPTRGGRERLAKPNLADALVRTGRYRRADLRAEEPTPAPTPPKPAPVTEPEGDEFDAMSYNDLRSLAAEQEVEVEGRKKDDYASALREYSRRDLIAED